MKITLPALPLGEVGTTSDPLNLFQDMILAGIVTTGFAVFYNTAWLHVGLAALGGMVGHGLRYSALQAGWNLDVATFLESFAVGIVAAWMARSYRLPVAVVSFAGSVTMMPSIQTYRALGGALQSARTSAGTDMTDVAATAEYALQAMLVVAAIGLGLVLATRIVPRIPCQRDEIQLGM